MIMTGSASAPAPLWIAVLLKVPTNAVTLHSTPRGMQELDSTVSLPLSRVCDTSDTLSLLVNIFL